jgi:Flp pilus assembly CpaE family ATPase
MKPIDYKLPWRIGATLPSRIAARYEVRDAEGELVAEVTSKADADFLVAQVNGSRREGLEDAVSLVERLHKVPGWTPRRILEALREMANG